MVDHFLQGFFAAPNCMWPGADAAHASAERLQPFLAALHRRGECPLVLPRRDDLEVPIEWYVICWDTAHVGRVRPLLSSAIAYNWCAFDGRVAHLVPSDPVHRAVLDLVGPGTTFVLKPPQETFTQTTDALTRMVASLADAPLRTPQTTRPIGRMLREFDIALAAGSAEASASLLREIEGCGGISHENVAFLHIRRLARLGLEHDLLAHPSLSTLVYTEPPKAVREGVLGAWARNTIGPVLDADSLAGGLIRIAESPIDFALLVDARLASTGDPDVATVCAMVALARDDGELAAAFAAHPGIASSIAERLAECVAPAPVAPPPAPPEPVQTPPGPTSWLNWVEQLGSAPARSPIADLVDDWAPSWSVDQHLAEAIDGLADLATDDLLDGVAYFLETDDPARPAQASAVALIGRYLVAERFGPADLGAQCSLLQIVLRAAPAGKAYRRLLDDIGSYAGQWVAIATAERAIDLADAVACGPKIDAEAQTNFLTVHLAPLHHQRARLSRPMRALASLISEEAALGWDWSVAESADSPAAVERDSSTTDPFILLYSLDSGSLQRTRTMINLQWPRARVEVSATKVGGDPALRQYARDADIIVIATRRAAHSATGYITAHASAQARIVYPDGSGSASMLRALESALLLWDR